MGYNQLSISQESKFLPNNWYFKVNFLIPENLLWNISSWDNRNLNVNRNGKYAQTTLFDFRWYFEISVSDFSNVDHFHAIIAYSRIDS